MLLPLVEEARALIETTPGATLPRAVRWAVTAVTKNAALRARIVTRTEGYLESLVEELTAVPSPALPPPVKKGRGKKAAPVSPAAPTPPPKAARELHELTPEEVVERALAQLSRGDYAVVADAINELRNDDVEEFVIDALNGDAHADLGPWSCDATCDAGAFAVELRMAGREQDEDTNLPAREDIDTARIERAFVHALGATHASVRWELDYTPREWDFSAGDKYVVAFDAKATWTYPEGEALRLALGDKELRDLAAKAIAAAKKD